MFSKVLIANRGEVALRINSTLERLAITAVGIYTAQESKSLHVQKIAESYCLQDSERSGYLDIEQIIEIALASRSVAIHPGYGFLAENAQFAKACTDAGLIFIGPSAVAIAAMGEKISARDFAIKAGVPVLPGAGTSSMTDEELVEACQDLEFPLLVKPAAGGGGKGLHVAHNFADLLEILPVARRESETAFGDGTLLVERYLEHARHIEFQVIADAQGKTMHLGERECSLQRRHQKVIEEAPAPGLSEADRETMGAAAVALASAIGYQNLGTIEFLVDANSPKTFYFMEMNTRLQVEHRVTEMITSLDLVECQLRIAAGEPLGQVIPKRTFLGHAIEARLYAEDAFNGFLPTGGEIGLFKPPENSHTIIDTAIDSGTHVSGSFDPMLAKISSWGVDRTAALNQLHDALGSTVVLGITTNIDFLIRLLEQDDIQCSRYDTKYLETHLMERREPSIELLEAYAAINFPDSKFLSWNLDGWRLRGTPKATVSAYIEGKRYEVLISGPSSIVVDTYQNNGDIWLHHPTLGTWLIKQASDLRRSLDAMNDAIVSPMPGVVVALKVATGDHVEIGDALVVIEAMKMEHIVRSRRAGVITRCNVVIGGKVKVGELLIEVVENV